MGFVWSPAWFGFAALASGLFFGIEIAAVAQQLGLVEGQPVSVIFFNSSLTPVANPALMVNPR